MLLANVVACANTSLLPGLPVHVHHHLHLQSLPKAPEHPRYRVDHVYLRKKNGPLVSSEFTFKGAHTAEKYQIL